MPDTLKALNTALITQDMISGTFLCRILHFNFVDGLQVVELLGFWGVGMDIDRCGLSHHR